MVAPLIAAALPTLAGLAIDLVPNIARWIGGAEAEDTAKRVLNVAQGVFGTTEPDAIAAAIAKDPAAASQFKIALANLSAEKERQAHEEMMARIADVASARSQTVELARMGSLIAWGAPIISVIVLATFGWVLNIVLTQTIPTGQEAIVYTMLGSLGTMASAVVGYWVGSSAGSAAKQVSLDRLNPASR